MRMRRAEIFERAQGEAEHHRRGHHAAEWHGLAQIGDASLPRRPAAGSPASSVPATDLIYAQPISLRWRTAGHAAAPPGLPPATDRALPPLRHHPGGGAAHFLPRGGAHLLAAGADHPRSDPLPRAGLAGTSPAATIIRCARRSWWKTRSAPSPIRSTPCSIRWSSGIQALRHEIAERKRAEEELQARARSAHRSLPPGRHGRGRHRRAAQCGQRAQ